jgi:hypothetical protein
LIWHRSQAQKKVIKNSKKALIFPKIRPKIDEIRHEISSIREDWSPLSEPFNSRRILTRV